MKHEHEHECDHTDEKWMQFSFDEVDTEDSDRMTIRVDRHVHGYSPSEIMHSLLSVVIQDARELADAALGQGEPPEGMPQEMADLLEQEGRGAAINYGALSIVGGILANLINGGVEGISATVPDTLEEWMD